QLVAIAHISRDARGGVCRRNRVVREPGAVGELREIGARRHRRIDPAHVDHLQRRPLCGGGGGGGGGGGLGGAHGGQDGEQHQHQRGARHRHELLIEERTPNPTAA